jgi:predicted Zn-dependent protease
MVPSSGSGDDPAGPSASRDDTKRPTRESPAWPRRRTAQLVALAVVVVALAGAALAFRAHHRKQVVAQGLARAEELLAVDTSAGYTDAARLLEPLTVLDPVNAGAARAFALAMLAADYRDEDALARAEALLVEGEAEDTPPLWADLANTMLSVSRGEAGSALASANRAGESPWARVVQARVAMLAGKPELAREPLDAAVQQQPRFPPALALRGDVLRRTGHAAQAADSYRAALDASPLHPRATYGLAKLALAGAVAPEEARLAVGRLLEDITGTPAVERARAAYHLASIEARAGDRIAASAAMDRAGVSGAARSWLERAVEAHASSRGYRVQDGAPPELRSASDDDPYVAPPRPPPSSAISPTFRLPEQAPRAPQRRTTKAGATATTKAGATKATSTKKPTPPKKPATKKTQQ